jgi:hypothetical protein
LAVSDIDYPAYPSSTVHQLPGAARGAFGEMADLVRRVPGFHLDLGPDTGTVPRRIQRFLEDPDLQP